MLALRCGSRSARCWRSYNKGYLELKTFGEPSKEKPVFADYKILAVGIDAPKDEIYSKINARVDEMIKDGLVDEVKHLS